MKENMPGPGPRACLAPLPCTPFRIHHVVLVRANLRCDRQALKRRSMAMFVEVPGRSRRAPAPRKAELGTSSDGLSFIAFGEVADQISSED